MQKLPLLFVGIVLLVCAALFQQRRSGVQSRVFRTRGTIIDKERIAINDETPSDPAIMREGAAIITVRYTPGTGEPLMFQTRFKAELTQQYEIGSEVIVLYDAQNPSRAKLAPVVNQRTSTIATTICLLVGACFLLYGLLSLMNH
jgi:hypothetical protein